MHIKLIKEKKKNKRKITAQSHLSNIEVHSNSETIEYTTTKAMVDTSRNEKTRRLLKRFQANN